MFPQTILGAGEETEIGMLGERPPILGLFGVGDAGARYPSLRLKGNWKTQSSSDRGLDGEGVQGGTLSPQKPSLCQSPQQELCVERRFLACSLVVMLHHREPYRTISV